MEGELNVAAAFDLQLTDDLDGTVVEHLEIMIVKRQDRRDDDRVTGMHTDRVDVFHAADRNRLVIGVTHDFKFDFLIALHALFDQDLMNRGKLEGIDADLFQFLFVIGKASAGAAQCEGRSQNDRITDMLRGFLGFFQAVGDFGRNDRFTDLLAHFLEHLTVFSPFDTLSRCTQQFNAALFQNTFLIQLHRQIQTGLSADAGNDRVRSFITQDLGNVFQGQRFHVNLVRHLGIRHDRGRIGIAQNDLITLFFQGQAGLCAGIVEFGGLTDNDRAGADDQYFFNVCSLCHSCSPRDFAYKRKTGS